MIKVFSRFTALTVWMLTVMVFIPTQIHAAVGDTFTKDHLKYTVLTEEETTGTAAVSGYSGEPEAVTIPDSVSNDAKTYSVTALGEDAFSWCDSLTTLTIPASVTSIAKNAFGACFGLERVYYEGNVPDTLPGLYDAAPDTLISYYKVANKTSWESVIEDDKWQDRSIEFKFTEGLQYQYNNDGTASVVGIGSATDNDIFIPSSVINEGKIYAVTSIGDGAFIKCSSLTSVMIPNSVFSINDYAFWKCDSLREIEISNSVISIGKGAFMHCTSLSEIIIPDSVIALGGGAFACTGLERVVFGNCVNQFNSEIVMYEKEGNSSWMGEYGVFENCTSLTSITIPDGVTSIGDRAFFSCTGLINMMIGKGVTSIGKEAFSKCSNLTSITIPDSVTSIGDRAFLGCKSLIGVTIPDSVTAIEKYTFSSCSNLTNVTLGNSVVFIGEYAFYSCNSLKCIYFKGNAPIIEGEGVFYNATIYYRTGTEGWSDSWYGRRTVECEKLTIQDGILYICDSDEKAVLFDYINQVDNIIIPEIISVDSIDYTVVSIGDSVFKNCLSLKSITIPNSVTSIGDSAFSGCNSLTSIMIPDSVTIIGNYAFKDCISLVNIIIPDSVTSIGCGAFFNCKNLNDINVDLNNPAYSSLEGVLFDKKQKVLIQYPLAREGKYIIPNSVTTIGYFAFAGCIETTSLIIPEGIEEIEPNAFYKFKGLQRIQLPSTLKTIGEDAFFGCINLQEINIPDSVTSIGAGAFANCKNLEQVDIPNYVKEIGDSAFYKCEKLKFTYVPDSCIYAGAYMFNYCHSLEKVIVGAGIGEIQVGFFLNCSNLREIYFLGDNPGLSCDMFFVHDYFEILNRSYSASDISPEFYFKAIQDNTPTIYYLQDRGGWNPSNYEEVLEIIRNSSSQHGLNNALNYCLNYTELKANENDFEYDGATIFSYKGHSLIIVIPDFVTEIGDNAFANCADISAIIVPKLVKLIGDKAFAYCSNLKAVQFRGDAPETPANVFEGDHCVVYYEKGTSGWELTWKGVDTLTITRSTASDFTYEINDNEITITGYIGTSAYVEIPSEINGYSVTRIAEYAFFGEKNIFRVYVPESVTYIGFGAFAGCTNLSIAVFEGEGNAELDNSVFCYCRNLSEIVLPKNIKSINDYVFIECKNLKSIHIPESVISIGDNAFSGCKNLKDAIVPDSVKNIGYNAFSECEKLPPVLFSSGGKILIRYSSLNKDDEYIVPDAVTTIACSAFFECQNLTNVIIPNSVTSIGRNAFQYCSSLTDIVIPDTIEFIGEEAFDRCYKLPPVLFSTGKNVLVRYSPLNEDISYIIPDSVNIISCAAFSECASLNSIIIPDSVIEIGEGAFSRCINLTDVSIPSSITKISSETFLQCKKLASIVIPDSITEIGDSAFFGCYHLVDVAIPDSVIEIGDSAFANCIALTNIVMPDSVAFIDDSAFYGCLSLKDIKISNSLINIPDNAFSGCFSLNSIKIPNGVNSIGDCAFYFCESLRNVYFQGNAPELGEEVFFNEPTTIYYLEGTEGWTNPWGGCPICIWTPVIYLYHPDGTATVTGMEDGISTDVIIPATVEKDGVTYTVTAISEKAFYGNDTLTSIIIPDSVFSIGTGAFSNCPNLTKVMIGKGVTTIGNGVFYGSASLTEVYFEGDAPELGKQVFFNTPATIYYQKGTEGWTDPWGGCPTVMISGEIPILTCALEGDMFLLKWTAGTDAVLQVSEIIEDRWADITEGVQIEDGNCIYKAPATAKQAFYRLKMP